MALEIPVFSSVMEIEPDTGFFICFPSVLVVHVVTEVWLVGQAGITNDI